MAIILKPFTFIPGTVIRSAQVNNDFDVIYSDYNGNIDNANIAAGAAIAFSKLASLASANILVGNVFGVPTSVAMSGDATISNTGAVTIGSSSPFLVPIGTIIPFYDFAGALTFSATNWAYCIGQAIAVGTIGVQTLPDLSNRYVVGFGTEGGGDNGSAPFLTPAIGNASHQTNLQHSHIVNSHSHLNPGTHTHTSASHSHAVSITSDFILTTGNQIFQLTSIASSLLLLTNTGFNGPQNGNHTHLVSGNTASTIPGPTGATALGPTATNAPGTNTGLSTTQDIQPRSIRVRWLMRIA